MAKICAICDRKAVVGHSRSHSNIATKRKMAINLQYKKVGGKKIIICTSCLKNLAKKHRQATS